MFSSTRANPTQLGEPDPPTASLQPEREDAPRSDPDAATQPDTNMCHQCPDINRRVPVEAGSVSLVLAAGTRSVAPMVRVSPGEVYLPEANNLKQIQ